MRITKIASIACCTICNGWVRMTLTLLTVATFWKWLVYRVHAVKYQMYVNVLLNHNSKNECNTLWLPLVMVSELRVLFALFPALSPRAISPSSLKSLEFNSRSVPPWISFARNISTTSSSKPFVFSRSQTSNVDRESRRIVIVVAFTFERMDTVMRRDVSPFFSKSRSRYRGKLHWKAVDVQLINSKEAAASGQ